MINIPEISLLSAFRNVLKLIRKDYSDCVLAGDETKSILYLITGVNELQRYKMFNEAKTLFITTENDPRHLDVNIFYNAKRLGIPTWHITLPSEHEKDNTVGIGDGSNDYIYDGTESYRRVLDRRFNAKYIIVVTSDNLNEVVLMYHFLKSTIISLTEHFHMVDLINLKLSGNDINLNSEIVPENVFSRGIGMDFEYNTVAYDLLLRDLNPFAIAGASGTLFDPDISSSL